MTPDSKELERMMDAITILKPALQFLIEANLIGGPTQLKEDIKRAYNLLIQKD